MVNVLWPATTAVPSVTWVCFLGFWLLNMLVVWRGVGVDTVSAELFGPVHAADVGIVCSTLCCIRRVGSGPMLAAPSKFTSTGAFLKYFLPALTGMVGYWATLSLNIPDFTRYAKRPGCADSGTGVRAAGGDDAVLVFGHCLHLGFERCVWRADLVAGGSTWPLSSALCWRFWGLIALLVATLNVNIGANVVGPSNDFANLAPKFISFRTGGLITAALGLAVMPWRLMSSSHNYLGWLVDYSAVLGPVAGIMVADYFLMRRRVLDVDALYRWKGVYEYRNGFNGVALIALTIGIVAALVGRFVPAFEWLFKLAWFVGFFVASAVYLVLMRVRGEAAVPASALEEVL